VDEKAFVAELVTEEEFEFDVVVTNKDGAKYFGGIAWKEFARIYHLEVGTELVFSIDKKGPSTPVTSSHLPITHPCTYRLIRIRSFYYKSYL
jgi:hypothetical protein